MGLHERLQNALGYSRPLNTKRVIINGCPLAVLLQRFTQLVEEPRVLDGDHRLRGEVFNQLDLLLGERTRL